MDVMKITDEHDNFTNKTNNENEDNIIIFKYSLL